MNKKWIKAGAAIFTLVLGIVGMNVIGSSGPEEEEKEVVETRPTVKVESIHSLNHQVKIKGHGEVIPVESTILSAQVSGEVISWHPNFVSGGLVKRGDVLFKVDPANYEAAVLQAEAALSSAQATLIEERGRADVAKREAKTLPNAKVTDLYLRKPQLLSAEAAMKSAQARLKLAQRDLSYCEVKAPYDALVVAREIGKGQNVNQGARVGEIYNIEVAEIIFPIAGFDSAFLPNQLLGLAADVSTDGRYSFNRPGKIVRDLGVVDSSTRMTNIVVQVEDPYSINSNLPKMQFGNYVTVSFDGQRLNNVFKLSQDLVTNNSVWIVTDENKLDMRNIEVIREEADYFIVGNGLENGNNLVLTLPEYPQKNLEVLIAGQKDIKTKDDSDAVSVEPTNAEKE
ncbi:MAG: RND family efflux transporter MFP subunit [Psychrosphaera sp.]|jgi:multidrug efflux system membrane fusion protein|uniref:Efflux RND transporter periplasmic adaptor subunit n=1 Tax=Psychrosphaera aquimarina TaxID=2044854 RepID=A0ABU3QYE8_9GAMM|nr:MULTISPECIES: efflux RND transporter periplasmic adaptor subunit [Psychrosphaera]MBU2918188.1 efflux RND transporter periplasmic adaptor subunit [Psychrosphaera sp. F3M07]MDU0112447.1 efflux RND transporter periplasmic adaptor subunit [Psychrosphaera aquimarina]